MPNLGERGERIVRRAARVLGEYGEVTLARELASLYRERPLPTVGQVPSRVADVVGRELAYTKGNEASEEWARTMLRRTEKLRKKVWLTLLQRPDRGFTPREVCRYLNLDAGEALNTVRRSLQEFQAERLVEIHGSRVLDGRERAESVRRLSRPARAYYAGEQASLGV